MSERLLAVFAHPDDESLLAGGTLAACAAGGVEVRVVSMTRGELGSGGRSEADAARLGAIREAELAGAAAALGICGAECLGYPDGELDSLDEVPAIDDLAARIRDCAAHTVITFAPEGLYWHPDHIAVHRLTAAALEAAPGGGAPRRLYGATWPDDLAARLVAQLESEGLPRDLWGLDPAAFGVPRRSITTVVDVSRFLEAKLTALSRHASQFPAGHALAAPPPRLAGELLGHEYFVRLDAAEDGDDWLARTAERSAPMRAGR